MAKTYPVVGSSNRYSFAWRLKSVRAREALCSQPGETGHSDSVASNMDRICCAVPASATLYNALSISSWEYELEGSMFCRIVFAVLTKVFCEKPTSRRPRSLLDAIAMLTPATDISPLDIGTS